MKLVVWTVFYVSIAGMFLAAMLRARTVREFVTGSWVAVTDRLESPPRGRVVEMFGKLISAFYLSVSGKLSKRKVFLLSFASAVAWSFIAVHSPTEAIPPEGWGTVALFSLGVVMLLPCSIVTESIQAKCLSWIYRQNREKGVISLLFDLMGFYSVLFLLGILAWWVFLQLPRWGGVFLVPLAIPALLPYSLSNPSLLKPNDLMILPLLITYAGGIILLIFSYAVCNSRLLLRCVQIGMEKLSESDCNAILAVSMFLFTLATGVMQAHSF